MGRWLLLGVFGAMTIVGAGMLAAPRAHAEIGAGCSATVNGTSIAGRDPDSPDDAIPVQQDEDVAVAFSGTASLLGYTLQMEFAGFRWTAKDFDDPDPDWGDTVPVADYAAHGVGLYKLVLETKNRDGSPGCGGAVLVDVEGDPLSTTAGIAAAVVTAVGALGLVASGANATRPSVKIKKKVDKWVLEQVDALTAATRSGDDPGAEASRLKRIQRLEGLGLGKLGKLRKLRGILTFLALPGLLLATGVVAPIGPGGGAEAGPMRLDRVQWKPRVSIVGVLAGVLISVGTVVLLQQYSEVYPTREISVVGLVLGVVAGLTVPSVFRVYDVWRANRVISEAERLFNAELRQRQSAAPASAPEGAAAASPAVAEAGVAAGAGLATAEVSPDAAARAADSGAEAAEDASLTDAAGVGEEAAQAPGAEPEPPGERSADEADDAVAGDDPAAGARDE